MEIIIYRHAEPRVSINEIISGRDFPLWVQRYNESGICIREFTGEKEEVVYVSDLVRSSETGRLIGKNVIQNPLFREAEIPLIKFPAIRWLLSVAQWLLVEHWQAFESRPARNVGSFRRQVAFLYPMCLDHVHPLTDSYGLADPFWQLLQGCLCDRPQYRLHHTQLRLEVLFEAFFYNSLTKLGGHLLNIAAVQIQLPGNLFIGQVQSHKIETQYPDLKGLMVSGEDSVCQIIEAFLTILTLITLSFGLLLMETSSDDSSGIAKRTLSAFWPTQFANRVVALGIIYQLFYVYLHLLGSFHAVGKLSFSFTTLRPWNPT